MSATAACALLAAPAQDIRVWRLAVGRPPHEALMLLDDDGCPWDKTAWQLWRVERWVPACGAAGLDPVPRPYDLRHSLSRCCSRPAISRCGVARQAGHSLGVLLSTYAHLMAEYEQRERIDPDAETAAARKVRTRSVPAEAT